MARGDLTLFEEFAEYLGDLAFNFNNGGDAIQLALCTTSAAPSAGDTTPVWGDYSANEVSGSNYSTGGAVLASQSWAEASGTATFDATDVTWTQHASGPSGIYWGILYDNTIASPADPAILFVDMGGAISLQDGDITVSWNSSGIFTIAA
jgi:hypothetical protein